MNATLGASFECFEHEIGTPTPYELLCVLKVLCSRPSCTIDTVDLNVHALLGRPGVSLFFALRRPAVWLRSVRLLLPTGPQSCCHVATARLSHTAHCAALECESLLTRHGRAMATESHDWMMALSADGDAGLVVRGSSKEKKKAKKYADKAKKEHKDAKKERKEAKKERKDVKKARASAGAAMWCWTEQPAHTHIHSHTRRNRRKPRSKWRSWVSVHTWGRDCRGAACTDVGGCREAAEEIA